MEEAASQLQRLTACNASVHRSISRLSASGQQRSHDTRKQLHDELENAMTLGKMVGHSLTSVGPVNERQRLKLQKTLEKELRKTQAMVAQLARVEEAILRDMPPRKSSSGINVADVDIASDNAADTPLLSQQYQQQRQEQLAVDMASEQVLRDEYDIEEIQSIQRDVSELNDMFKDINYLVMEQQDTLDCIEDNIASTAANTRAGYTEVEKAHEYQRRSRNRMCKLLVMLLIVATIAVLVVVGIIKS